jgi:hypothetical protein
VATTFVKEFTVSRFETEHGGRVGRLIEGFAILIGGFALGFLIAWSGC